MSLRIDTSGCLGDVASDAPTGAITFGVSFTEQVAVARSVGNQPDRCPVNQAAANSATCSRVPGSSNKWVASGTMASS